MYFHFIFMILSIFGFVYFTTGIDSGWPGLCLSLMISAIYFVFFFKNKTRNTLYLYIASVLLGFLCFHFFRLIGLAFWPINYSRDVSSYFWLLYWHFVLSVSVLTPLFISHCSFIGTAISENNIKFSLSSLFVVRRIEKIFYYTAIIISVISWVVAFWINLNGKSFGSIGFLFFLICIAKAFLNSITEEIVFRGFIQSSSIKYFGVLTGVIFQSTIYTLFHLFLGPGDMNRYLFIVIVFFIGILLGVLTYFNKSIIFPVIIHGAIDMVVEWSNIL